MKFANKEFKDYWKIIKLPVYIIVGWSVLSFIMSIISYDLYSNIFSSGAGFVLMLAIFGFIGWTAVKDYKGTVKIGAWSGALAGAITGFVGAIISILMFYIVPDVILAAAAQAGADPSQIQGFMAIGIYIGLVTGPLFSGLIGALLSTIAAFIATKIKK